MKLILVLEDVAHLVYLKEGGVTLSIKRTAEVGYLVIHAHIALLLQHAYGGIELVVGRHLLLLNNRNDTIAQVEPSLRLVHQADSKDGCGTTERTEMTCRLS